VTSLKHAFLAGKNVRIAWRDFFAPCEHAGNPSL